MADLTKFKTPADKLPDVLHESMSVIFVGTAAGHRSALNLAYYAHPGNRFWQTLHQIGLTDRRYAPTEFRELAKIGIGFTDIVKSSAGSDKDIAGELAAADLGLLEEKIQRWRPRAVAFTSKKAGSIYLRTRTTLISYGRQRVTSTDCTEVFVLPSTSGLAAGYWDLKPWQELADLLRGARS
jgi:double-stranded uracil-DNA glycosylase